MARSARRTIEQVVSAAGSTDTFATPSENPTPDSQALNGPEPAIFGGVNPVNPPPPQLPGNPGSPAEEVEDEVTAGPIVAPKLRSVLAFVVQSNLVLLILLGLLFALGSWVISETLPARNEVAIRIELRSAIEPTPEEIIEQQQEINAILRGYPLRKAAKEILSAESPQISPGFLDGMAFSSSNDTIAWDGYRSLTLRVNTVRPADDGPRLHAAARAFLQVSDVRRQAYEARLASAENYRLHLKELQGQQRDLLADQARETDPAAAARLAEQARKLEQRIAATAAEIEHEQRAVDTWITPDRIDPAGVQAHDNRPLRRKVIATLSGSLLLLLGTPIVINLRAKRRLWQDRRRRNVTTRRQIQAG